MTVNPPRIEKPKMNVEGGPGVKVPDDFDDEPTKAEPPPPAGGAKMKKDKKKKTAKKVEDRDL